MPLMLVVLNLTMSTASCNVAAFAANNIHSWKCCPHLFGPSRISTCNFSLNRVSYWSANRCEFVKICERHSSRQVAFDFANRSFG